MPVTSMVRCGWIAQFTVWILCSLEGFYGKRYHKVLGVTTLNVLHSSRGSPLEAPRPYVFGMARIFWMLLDIACEILLWFEVVLFWAHVGTSAWPWIRQVPMFWGIWWSSSLKTLPNERTRHPRSPPAVSRRRGRMLETPQNPSFDHHFPNEVYGRMAHLKKVHTAIWTWKEGSQDSRYLRQTM